MVNLCIVFFGLIGCVEKVYSAESRAVSWTFLSPSTMHVDFVNFKSSSSWHQQVPTQAPLLNPSPYQSRVYTQHPWEESGQRTSPQLAFTTHLHTVPLGPPLRAAVHCFLFQLTVCVSCCCAVFSLHSPLAQLQAQVSVASSSALCISPLASPAQASPER